MKIRIKKTNKDGIVRLESSGEIKEILIKEDIIHPEKESVSICFKGANSSGILDLSIEEIQDLYDNLKNYTHLIKGLKKFKV